MEAADQTIGRAAQHSQKNFSRKGSRGWDGRCEVTKRCIAASAAANATTTTTTTTTTRCTNPLTPAPQLPPSAAGTPQGTCRDTAASARFNAE